MNLKSDLDPVLLADQVRDICIRTALEGYEDAAISGLCHEGAWEAAISAMNKLDFSKLLEKGNDKLEQS